MVFQNVTQRNEYDLISQSTSWPPPKSMADFCQRNSEPTHTVRVRANVGCAGPRRLKFLGPDPGSAVRTRTITEWWVVQSFSTEMQKPGFDAQVHRASSPATSSRFSQDSRKRRWASLAAMGFSAGHFSGRIWVAYRSSHEHEDWRGESCRSTTKSLKEYIH